MKFFWVQVISQIWTVLKVSADYKEQGKLYSVLWGAIGAGAAGVRQGVDAMTPI